MSVRAITCISDPSLQQAMSAVLGELGVTTVGNAGDLSRVAAAFGEHQAEFLVAQVETVDSELEALLEHEDGRPIAAIFLTPAGFALDDTARRVLKRSRSTTISRNLALRRDDEARAHFVTRVRNFVSTRKTNLRSTVPDSLIAEAVARVMHHARLADVSRQATVLASWPADLIVLVGGDGSIEILESIAAEIYELPVPVLALIRDEEPSTVAARVSEVAHVPVQVLARAFDLGQLSGLFVAGASGVEALGRALRPSAHAGASRVERSLQDIASLASGLMLIQLSDHMTTSAAAITEAGRSGAVSAMLIPDDCASPEGPLELRRLGVAKAELTVEELRWLLTHAVPRRI